MRANTKWTILCDALLTWLVKNYTQRDLCRAILQRIREWRTGQAHQPITGPRTLKRAIYEQDDIGWENFIMGRISQRFAVFQHNHFRHTGKKSYGRVWATRLITQLWELPWGMWEHRNDILHNGTTRQQKEELDQLRQQVRAQFCLGNRGIPPTDQYLLEDKATVLAYDLPNTIHWLTTIKEARKSHVRLEAVLHDRLKKSRAIMSNWLQSAN
jgi:hypothetical protein